MSNQPNLPDESFRDSISTISEDGKRNYIFPKKPSGPFYDKRKILSYFLLAFLIFAPFIKINGNQFLMFNVLERRFNIFSFPFWPQDFHLFVKVCFLQKYMNYFTLLHHQFKCSFSKS